MAELAVNELRKSFGDHEVLKGVSFHVKSGNFLSLLGPSGCGKSTILRIICGLETADSGEVLVDGKDVTKIRPEKRGIGLVFQNYALFPSMNVEKNVGYGLKMQKVPQAEISRRVAEALEQVKLGGYQPRKVTQLSGGEQQRVALARAILKDAPIVVLDEATAFADPENEAMIQKAFAALTKDRTVIMIAHRLSTVVNADKIIVLDSGRVEEQGTHAELVRANGLYARMWADYNQAVQWKISAAEVK